MNYPTDPLEHLTAEDLESIAEYEHPIQGNSIQNIQGLLTAKVTEAAEPTRLAVVADNADNSARRRSPRKYLLVAAIVVAFVALAGFTNASRIYELYYQYFGAGAQISQYVAEIGQSTVDQGFKLEVLSAVNDGDNTYLFVDITDMTGDRLTENTIINRWGMTGSRPMGGGGTTLVGYDPDTRTATFMIHSISAKPGDSVLFTLSSFMSDSTDYRIVEDDINITQLLEENEGNFITRSLSGGTSGGMSTEFYDEGNDLNNIGEILELDAIDMALPGLDHARISNIAYRDGMLHVQLNSNLFRGNAATWLSLVSMSTGEEIQPYYSIDSGERNVDGLADHSEFVFVIDRDALRNYRFLLEGFIYAQVFDGTWEVGFEVPERMETIIKQTDTSIVLGTSTVRLESIEVSPMSITVRTQSPRQGNEELHIVVTYQDGSTLTISEGKINTIILDASVFTFVSPIRDIHNIDYLEINGSIIDF